MLIGKPREVKLETLIITKEGWKLLRQHNRKRYGCKPLTEEQLESAWNRCCQHRNGGASSRTHPIADNEYRITLDTFSIGCDTVKEMLKKAGLTFRTDGFIEECIYL